MPETLKIEVITAQIVLEDWTKVMTEYPRSL